MYVILSLLIQIFPSYANIFINEISDKGTESICDNEDWIELYNDGSSPVSLTGFLLHDDKGPLDSKAYRFGASGDTSSPTVIAPKSYLLLCCNGDGVSSPAFKIGGDDTVRLIDDQDNEVDSSGVLPDTGEFDITYARNDGAGFVQTITPTPGAENIINAKPVIVEDYREQNSLGTPFFGMTEEGSVPGVDAVMDLYATVDSDEWDSLMSNPYTETYISVQEFKLVGSEGTLVLASPGRMRPRGQSTLVYPICMAEDAIPFKLDFASANSTQTLFGVERAYLRTHLNDRSKMKEWVTHRMLARFGLPYLRTRHVKFYVNGKQLGFYTFMEAPDQDYVMARTFGYSYDKNDSALYKVKTMSLTCGDEKEYGQDPGYTEKCTSPDGAGGTDCCADLSWGEPKTCADGYSVEDLSELCMYTCRKEADDKNSSSLGPYAYERGDHREEVIVLKNNGYCWNVFFGKINKELGSVVRAFYDAGYTSASDCGDFLLSHNLVDRDLGKKGWDDTMSSFINSHLGVNGQCNDSQCLDKRLIKEQVDVDNWLKNFAVYAVTLEQDSPMGNGNNYFLAAAGDSTTKTSPKWKIIPYDHNNDMSAASILCDKSCASKDILNWSIIRPTCRGLSENPLVGPLLLDSELHTKYLSFVREFVENVYTNESLLQDMGKHFEAIETAANDSPDSSTYGNIDRLILSRQMVDRADRVLKQLKDWNNGNFPDSASIESIEACVSSKAASFMWNSLVCLLAFSFVWIL